MLTKEQMQQMLSALTPQDIKYLEHLVEKDVKSSKRFTTSSNSTVCRKKYNTYNVHIIHFDSCLLCGEVTRREYDTAIKTQEKPMDVQTLNTHCYTCSKCYDTLNDMPQSEAIKRTLSIVKQLLHLNEKTSVEVIAANNNLHRYNNEEIEEKEIS